MADLVDLVHRFRRLRALVIGDALLDTYLEGTAARLCTEGPVPVIRKTAEEHVPGGAANTAANVRSLGAEVTLLGIVGRDAAGTCIRAALTERGVDDGFLVEDPSVGTLQKTRILADDQYVVRFDAGETLHPSPQARRQLLANLERAFERCDLVVVSDYCYGAVSDDLIERLRALRAERPCVLVVDSKNLGRFRHAAATVITPNHFEARLTVEPGGAAILEHRLTRDPSTGPVDLAEMEEIGRQLLAMIDAEHAAITLAANGALLVDRHQATHVPAHSVAKANDVGAGDSFTAAAALGLAAGGTPLEAARVGVGAGSIAVTKRRTALVRHQELLQRVSLETAAPSPTLQRLLEQIDEERARGKRIVFTNGVFDILHAGHVHFLHAAKNLGDVLVVGVNSDGSARRLKGENRPITGERDRLALVAALDPVDHAVLFDEDTPTELIRSLRPDIHVKGGDYAGEALPEAEAVRAAGGRVVILPLLVDGGQPERPYSSSIVIDRIVRLALDGRIGVTG